MKYSFSSKVLAALSSAAVLLPGSALAASSWSAVSVQQDQNAVSWHHPVDLNQAASINTGSNVGNQAHAQSRLDGNQQVWLGSGKGAQAQDLQAGARIDWNDDRRWPVEAQASTVGRVDQNQSGWSNHPIKEVQNSAGWLRSNIGSTEANADFGASQTNIGAVGDVVQHQRVRGQTEVDGYINPSFPAAHGGFGAGLGSIFQNVSVNVFNTIGF